jgi:hypothetical protein
MVKNYYFILGLSNNASVSEITEAYEEKKRLAEQDAAEAVMFAEITEAYECLIDPVRKEKYDGMITVPSVAPAGNIYQYSSPESRMKAELEYKKLRNKHYSRKKIVKRFSMLVVFLIFAGVGLSYGMKYYARDNSLDVLPAVLKPPDRPRTPKPETEEPPVFGAAAKSDILYARTYEMKTGGLVVGDRAPCRAQPSENSEVVASVRRNTVVFAIKEARGLDGNVWYYIFNSQLEGWMNGRDVHIYNKY